MPRGRDTSRDPRRRARVVQWDPIAEEYAQKMRDRQDLERSRAYETLKNEPSAPYNFDNAYLYSGLYWIDDN